MSHVRCLACLVVGLSLAFTAHGQSANWRQLLVSGEKPFRSFPGIAYNFATDRLVMLGGSGNEVATGNGVWILRNATGRAGTPQWLNAIPDNSPGAPLVRSIQDTAYDPINNRLILFGGDNCGSLQDSWVLKDADGTTGAPTWTRLFPGGEIPTGAFHAVGYDPITNRLMVALGYADQGGCPSVRLYRPGEAWVLTNANGVEPGNPTWIKLATGGDLPPGRITNQLTTAYDGATNRLIVFGGLNNSGALSDLSILTNANGFGGQPNWLRIDAAGGPSPRWGAAGFYDKETNQLLVFGGLANGSMPSNEVWILSNANALGGAPSWRQVGTSNTIPARFGAAGAYNAAGDQMILFGGVPGSGGVATDEVWILDRAVRSSPTNPCEYQMNPASASYPATGGSGVLTVRSSAVCPFPIVISSSWITNSTKILLPQVVIPGLFRYAYDVAANSAASRAGSISIGTATHAVYQNAGAGACALSINPSAVSVSASTLSAALNVTTSAPGCSWSAIRLSGTWASAVNGSNRSGSGSLSFSLQPNSGSPRTAQFDIGGRVLQISQSGASACGATDVTASVAVNRGLFFFETLGNFEVQEVTFTNSSQAAIPGPLFVVFDGLPRIDPRICPRGCSVFPALSTTCYVASGSAYLPISQGGLARGASIRLRFSFTPGPSAGLPGNSTEKFRYTPRILSGAPNQ